MITLQINGLNKLAKIAEQYPAVSEKHINLAISRALVRIFGEEKVQAPFGVSGLLRDNWRVETGRFQGSLTSLAPYAADVEYGTLPHTVSGEELMPWAKKKGLNPWAVARSIAKKGTKANPFFQRAIDNTSAEVQGEFSSALEKTMSEITSFSDTI